MAMTDDLIAVRRSYRGTFINWPGPIIDLYLETIDDKVAKMHPDEMLEARQLMDEKITTWK
jgi:hypothetical protein